MIFIVTTAVAAVVPVNDSVAFSQEVGVCPRLQDKAVQSNVPDSGIVAVLVIVQHAAVVVDAVNGEVVLYIGPPAQEVLL